MEKVPHFQDMAIKPKEIENVKILPQDTMPSMPIYPYGLCISLDQDSIALLDSDLDECQVGDIIHGHFLANVTCVSENSTTDGTRKRIELQITHLSAEDEDEENEEDDAPKGIKMNKMYGGGSV